MSRFRKTERGFAIREFTDDYGNACSIQRSSSAEKAAIWFGVNSPNAKILPGDGTGWHDYPLPENVSCTTRMHLTRRQVRDLLPALQRFAKTGKLAWFER